MVRRIRLALCTVGLTQGCTYTPECYYSTKPPRKIVVSRPELNRLVVKDDYQWKGSQLIPAPVDKNKEVERRVKGISEYVN